MAEVTTSLGTPSIQSLFAAYTSLARTDMMYGHRSVVNRLLKTGADIEVKNT